MRVIVIHVARDLRVERRPAGEPAQGKVLLRVAVGGVCGSDLIHLTRGLGGDMTVAVQST